MAGIFSEEVKKAFMAGVGAIAAATEKTADFAKNVIDNVDEEKVKATFEELSQKGREVWQQGKEFSAEMREKVAEAFDKDIDEYIKGLSDEELEELIDKAHKERENRIWANVSGDGAEADEEKTEEE